MLHRMRRRLHLVRAGQAHSTFAQQDMTRHGPDGGLLAHRETPASTDVAPVMEFQSPFLRAFLGQKPQVSSFRAAETPAPAAECSSSPVEIRQAAEAVNSKDDSITSLSASPPLAPTTDLRSAAAAVARGTGCGIASAALSRSSLRASTSLSPAPPVPAASQHVNHIPSPYPTEGGHVPIFILVNNRVQKRNWVHRNAQWCDLCKEPVDSWVNHHGRKDHALLDLHYTALVEYRRRWNPQALLREFLESELKMDMAAANQYYARVYDRERRNELYAMLVKLEEMKVIHFGEPRQTFLSRMQGSMRGMDLQGALVLHRFLLGPFMRLYPDGHIQDFSNLVDFITCSYNMETIYDLCGFYTLDKVAIKADYKPSSPAALGLGGIASHSSATTGFHHDVRSGLAATPAQQASMTPTSSLAAKTAAAAAADLEEEAFSRKAVFVRQLLGQLRWVTLPDQRHPAGFEFPEHVVTLSEVCLKALVAEIACIRLSEYMVRAEPVWRENGYERKKLVPSQIAKSATDIVPDNVRYFYRPMSPQMDDLFNPSETPVVLSKV